MRLKMYAFYSESHRDLLQNYFLPSLENTDVELVLRQIDQIGSGLITSAEWGNIMLRKVDFILEAVQENFGSYFIFSDIDICFFRNISDDLSARIAGKDILFQAEDYMGRFNLGFFVCRGNAAMVTFWSEIKRRLEQSVLLKNTPMLAEQYYANEILFKDKHTFRFGLLPVEEYSGSRFVYTEKTRFTIARTIRIHHANWTLGSGLKQHNLAQVQNIIAHQEGVGRLYFFLIYYWKYMTHPLLILSGVYVMTVRMYFRIKNRFL